MDRLSGKSSVRCQTLVGRTIGVLPYIDLTQRIVVVTNRQLVCVNVRRLFRLLDQQGQLSELGHLPIRLLSDCVSLFFRPSDAWDVLFVEGDVLPPALLSDDRNHLQGLVRWGEFIGLIEQDRPNWCFRLRHLLTDVDSWNLDIFDIEIDSSYVSGETSVSFGLYDFSFGISHIFYSVLVY